ncbi:hypothetical protein GGS20DRAFT_572672 [Poronia punctata]|nr:hypothetical protein GGS20DRAFT_572672 [Poronia punctata]
MPSNVAFACSQSCVTQETSMSSDTLPFLSQVDGVDSSSSSSERCEYRFHDITTGRTLSPKSHKRRLLSSIGKGLVISLAIWGFFNILRDIARVIFPHWNILSQIDVYRPETLPPGLSDCLCGHTLETALSLDCVYDSLSIAWLPPECRDDALTEKFDHAGPGPGGSWGYYLDPNGTIPLSKDEIADLGPKGGSFWASADWHIAHCAFYYQKYKRMGQTGVVMEARYDSLMHVEHCGKLIINPGPDYFYLIEVPVRMNGSVDVGPVPPTRVGPEIPNPFGPQRSQDRHR